MKLLVEYIADQHRKERERYAKTYETVYEKPAEDTDKQDNKGVVYLTYQY